MKNAYIVISQVKEKEQDLKKQQLLWPASATFSDSKTLSKLAQDFTPVFERIMAEEQLGHDIAPQFSRFYLPFAQWLAHKHQQQPVVIGINGAQGSGKSTLNKILKNLLAQVFDKSVIELSIDDFYLSRQKREALAKDVHPLLKTRGVPGTHDTALMKSTFSILLDPSPGLKTKLPVFNKAADDLLAEEDWLEVTNEVDIILFEGWCVGAQPQSQDHLEAAVNELESNEDPDLTWRNYINKQLSESYQDIFSYIDYQVMLKAPDMDSVLEWRCLQEEKLALKCEENKTSTKHLMSTKEIERFIMHYERITCSTLDEMPQRADVTLHLNKQHQVNNVHIRELT